MRTSLIIISMTAALLAGCTAPEPSRIESRSPEPHSPPPARTASEATAAQESPREVVEEFGQRLDMVSTLAPPSDVEKAMRQAWSGLVAPELLDRWIAAPATSPGRTVSSPRPDRIEVETVSMATADRAVVDGSVVEMTSSGESSRNPVRIDLERRGKRWLITRFSPAEISDGTADDDPAAAVEEYYAAIAARDFRRAWDLWGSEGAPGQSFDDFVRGFADTASVRVETGTPSRMEAAAGSRYVEVPVKVEAVTKSGQQQRFKGSYTLRRSVVDGATPAQRRWHLYRASLHAAPH